MPLPRLAAAVAVAPEPISAPQRYAPPVTGAAPTPSSARGSGNAGAQQMPAGYAPPPPAHVARSILPPRTTASQYVAEPQGDERSAWRHWPVVVIVLALVAIAAAFAVMLWPPAKPATGQRAIDPPAPLDHMDTQPLPPAEPTAPKVIPAPTAPPADPWTDKHSDRLAPNPYDSDPLALPPDRRADPSPADPYADLNIDLMTAALQHFCRARAGCPDGDAVLEGACVAALQQHPSPPTCAAARRCLAQFDHMSCSSHLDLDGVQNMFATIDDCSEATHC